MPHSSTAPRRGRPGYDRQTLLTVCVDVFNRHGYEATSMGMLAQHLGISKSAIYHHVESKEAILEQALDDALDALEASLDGVMADFAGPGEQVEAAVRGTLRVLVEKMPEVTLLLRLRGNSAVELAAMERRRAITRRLGEMIAAAQEAGAVRGDITPEPRPPRAGHDQLDRRLVPARVGLSGPQVGHRDGRRRDPRRARWPARLTRRPAPTSAPAPTAFVWETGAYGTFSCGEREPAGRPQPSSAASRSSTRATARSSAPSGTPAPSSPWETAYTRSPTWTTVDTA